MGLYSCLFNTLSGDKRMVSNFQKFVNYFKENYHPEEKEIIMGELVFKELFYSNISNERQNYAHVAKLFAHHGLVVMISKARYVVNLDLIRSFSGVTSREKV